MLTNDDPGYVDLTSPAGIGIGALVYNYDGDVYASDEGRMLAEMGDTTFRLGNLHRDSYEEIMLSEALLEPLEESLHPERADVLGLRVRALLRRRPDLPPRHPGRLCRPQADLGLLPPQHGDLQAAARPLRGRPEIRERSSGPGRADDRAARQGRRGSRSQRRSSERSGGSSTPQRSRRGERRARSSPTGDGDPPEGFDLYLIRGGDGTPADADDRSSCRRSFDYLSGGDVVAISDGRSAHPRALAPPAAARTASC